MVNSSGGDEDRDARKKRDNAKVNPDGKDNAIEAKHQKNDDVVTENDKNDIKNEGTTHTTRRNEINLRGDSCVWDLESALLYLVQIGGHNRRNIPVESNTTHKNSTTNDGCDNVRREFLTTDEDASFITFRIAHAGDAASIASLYRKQKSADCLLDHRYYRQVTPPTHKDEEEKEDTAIVDHEEDPEIDKCEQSNRNNNVGVDEEAYSTNDQQHNSNNNKNDSNSIDINDSSSNTLDDEDESLQLEHWLSEGLGDEITCPSVYGLLAYVHRSSSSSFRDTNNDATTENNVHEEEEDSREKHRSNEMNNDKERSLNNSSGTLNAVVLMSLAWSSGQRNLRIEWMLFDSEFQSTSSIHPDEASVVKQKVWLRINTLSVMTGCQAISIDDNNFVVTTSSTNNRILPSAE